MIQKVKHVKASTWIPKEEYDAIERIKGDISASLWIKRAIRKSLSEGEGTNQAPKAANYISNATTPSHHQGTNSEEVQVL